MAKFKRSFLNPMNSNYHMNSIEEYFDFTNNMKNDVVFDYSMNQERETLLDGVVLSGYRTNDNTGTGFDPSDAEIKIDPITGKPHLFVTIMPLGKIGGSKINQYIDPRNYDNIDTIKEIINIHTVYNRAKSEYIVNNTSMALQFGQRVKYYKDYTDSESGTLIFKKPDGESHIEPSIINIYGAEVQNPSAVNLFNQAISSIQQLGVLSDGSFDPNYPPIKRKYIGSNSAYRGQVLKNGLLPPDLIGIPTRGGPTKGTMLKEVVNFYDQMCIAFRAKFPNKKLGNFGYRPYSRQLSIKKEKPNLAAKPGTSNHGWGLAIDIHFYIDGSSRRRSLTYNGPEYQWLLANARSFGFDNPSWAKQGGKKEEPWHWEWVNKSSIIEGLTGRKG